MSQRIGQILYGSWGLLGFYRGVKYYNYYYEEDMKYYLKDPMFFRKPQKFYITEIAHGGLGTLIYIAPIICVLPAIKELYRLEINLRGLEEEKKKKDYYNIFF